MRDKTGTTILKKVWRKMINDLLIRIETQADVFVRNDMNEFLADVIDDNIQGLGSQIINVIAFR